MPYERTLQKLSLQATLRLKHFYYICKCLHVKNVSRQPKLFWDYARTTVYFRQLPAIWIAPYKLLCTHKLIELSLEIQLANRSLSRKRRSLPLHAGQKASYELCNYESSLKRAVYFIYI